MYKDNFLGKGNAPTSGHGAHYSKNAAPLDQPPLPRKNPRSAPAYHSWEVHSEDRETREIETLDLPISKRTLSQLLGK